MVKINLLPPEILQRRLLRQRQLRWVAIAFLMLGVAFAAFSYLFLETIRVRSEAGVLSAELAVTQAEIQTYSLHSQLQSRVNERVAELRRAMDGTPHWQDLLVAIGSEIPNDVWVTDLITGYQQAKDKKEASGQFQIRGLTHDHPSVAGWLALASEIPELEAVECSFSSLEDIEGSPLVQYELRALVRPGAQYDPFAERGR